MLVELRYAHTRYNKNFYDLMVDGFLRGTLTDEEIVELTEYLIKLKDFKKKK